MKKRFLMMMLAGVLAFSMIGCGGNDAPVGDDAAEDTATQGAIPFNPVAAEVAPEDLAEIA